MVKEVVTDGCPQKPLDYSAAQAAYENAQADFDSRKSALWATRILQEVFDSDAHHFDAAVLQRETQLLRAAMAKFELATSSEHICGGPVLMAAVIANYYSHEFVLDDTIWGLPVVEMAVVEKEVDAELGKAEVEALYLTLCKAKRDAEALAGEAARPLAVGVALSSTMSDRIERGELSADMMARFGLNAEEQRPCNEAVGGEAA